MRVEFYERARFLVESESDRRRAPYLVDRLEYRRHGQCDCEHFRIRIQTKWEAGEVPDNPACKHIRRVDRVIARAAGLKRVTAAEAARLVKRFLFQLARFEYNCQTNPDRYGTHQ